MTATVDSLAVSWTAPSGAVTSYTVTVKEGTTIKDTKTVTGTTATLDSSAADKKLTAGTEYTVEVVSVAGVLNSDSSLSGNFYTSKSVLD